MASSDCEGSGAIGALVLALVLELRFLLTLVLVVFVTFLGEDVHT